MLAGRLLLISALVCVAVAIRRSHTEDLLQHAIQPTTGGAPAQIANAPFMAFVFMPAKGERDSCGGAIIGASWVLTARHCIPRTHDYTDFKRDWKVQAGSVDRTAYSTLPLPAGVQVRSIDGVVTPAAWVPVGARIVKDDIMLLHVSPPFDLNATPNQVNRIPIAAPNAPNGGLPNDNMATLFGWGSQELPDHSFGQPPLLQTASIGPMLTGGACRALAAVNDQALVDWDKVFCYGNLPVSSSQGDSGGPYVANGNLVGVVSGSAGPTVITKVSAYAQWIAAVMNAAWPTPNPQTLAPPSLVMRVTWNPPPANAFANPADLAHWGTGDGCDCAIPPAPGQNVPMDPDCEYNRVKYIGGFSQMRGCPVGATPYVCENNACQVLSPAEWGCAISAYGDFRSCDKHCGTKDDPDCAFHAHVPMLEFDNHCGGGNTPYLYEFQDRCKTRTCCRAKHTLVKNACQWIDTVGGGTCAALPKHVWPKKANKESKFAVADDARCDPTSALITIHECRSK